MRISSLRAGWGDMATALGRPQSPCSERSCQALPRGQVQQVQQVQAHERKAEHRASSESREWHRSCGALQICPGMRVRTCDEEGNAGRHAHRQGAGSKQHVAHKQRALSTCRHSTKLQCTHQAEHACAAHLSNHCRAQGITGCTLNEEQCSSVRCPQGSHGLPTYAVAEHAAQCSANSRGRHC